MIISDQKFQTGYLTQLLVNSSPNVLATIKSYNALLSTISIPAFPITNSRIVIFIKLLKSTCGNQTELELKIKTILLIGDYLFNPKRPAKVNILTKANKEFKEWQQIKFELTQPPPSTHQTPTLPPLHGFTGHFGMSVGIKMESNSATPRQGSPVQSESSLSSLSSLSELELDSRSPILTSLPVTIPKVKVKGALEKRRVSRSRSRAGRSSSLGSIHENSEGV